MDWKQQLKTDFQCFLQDYTSKGWKEYQSIWNNEYSRHLKNLSGPIILLSAPPYQHQEAEPIPLALFVGAIGNAPVSKVFLTSTWSQLDFGHLFPTILKHVFELDTNTVLNSFFDSNVYHSKQPRLDTERYIVESIQDQQFYLKSLDVSIVDRMGYTFGWKELQFVWIGYHWNTDEPCPSNLTIIDLEVKSSLEGLEKVISLCKQKYS
jgi:hypothetical protein